MYVSKRSSGQKRKEMGEWEQQQKKIARRKSIGEEKESESVCLCDGGGSASLRQ